MYIFQMVPNTTLVFQGYVFGEASGSKKGKWNAHPKDKFGE